MKLALVSFAAVIGIVLIAICCIMSSKNGAISLEESVSTAKSGIDVQLSNRFNKLNELAECVKKYDSHEYKTLVDTIAQRGKNMTSQELKQSLLSIAKVAEAYPNLQSQKNYQMLMTEISLVENHLAQHKKAYNEFVRQYNYYVRKFPTDLFLQITSYMPKKFEYYEAEESVKDNKPLKLFD